MAITVTATEGGSTANGLALRVFVLTQAAATQSGATSNNQFASATSFTQSVTTTQTGSRVYGASAVFPNNSATAAAATTVVDNVSDATNNARYVTFKATSLTGTPGATTLGFTVATASGPFAQAEILTAGTLTEDASAPAVASTTGASTVTTAAFTPPAGSLLVALVAADGGGTVTTMTVSGGGLSWTEKVKNNPSAGDYAGVWIAQVPAAGQAVLPPLNPPGLISPAAFSDMPSPVPVAGLTDPQWSGPVQFASGREASPPLIPPGLFTTPGAQFPAPVQGDPSFAPPVPRVFPYLSDFIPGLAEPGYATPANPDAVFTTAEQYIGTGYQPPQAPPFAPGFCTPSSWAQPGTGLTDPSWTGPPAAPPSSLPQFLDQSGSRPRGALRVRHGTFVSPGQFNLAAQPLPGFTDQAGYRPRSAPRIARGSFRASLPQGNQGVPFPLQLRQPYPRLTLRRSAGRFFVPGQLNQVAPQLPSSPRQAAARRIITAVRPARGQFFTQSWGQGNQGTQFPLYGRQPYQRITLRRSNGRFFTPGQFNQVAPAFPSFTRAGTSPQRLILRRSQGTFQLPGLGQGNQGTAFPQLLRQSQARRVVAVIRPARGQLFMQAWGQFIPPAGITSGAEQQLPLIAPPFTTPGSFAQPWVPLTDPGIAPGAAPVPQMLQRTARGILRARSGKFFTPGQFSLSAQPYPSFTRARPAPALPVRRGRWLNPGQFNLDGNLVPAAPGTRRVPAAPAVRHGRFFAPGQFNLTGNTAPAPAWTRRPAAAPKTPRGRFASPGQFTLAAGQLPGFTRAPKRPAVAALRHGTVFAVPAARAVPAVPQFLSPRRPGPVLRKRGNEFQRVPAPAVIPAYPADFRTTRRFVFTRLDGLRRGRIIQLVPFQAASAGELRISLGEPEVRWVTSSPAVRWSTP